MAADARTTAILDELVRELAAKDDELVLEGLLPPFDPDETVEDVRRRVNLRRRRGLTLIRGGQAEVAAKVAE